MDNNKLSNVHKVALNTTERMSNKVYKEKKPSLETIVEENSSDLDSVPSVELDKFLLLQRTLILQDHWKQY